MKTSKADSIVVALRLDKHHVNKIDKLAKMTARTRANYLRVLIEWALQSEERKLRDRV